MRICVKIALIAFQRDMINPDEVEEALKSAHWIKGTPDYKIAKEKGYIMDKENGYAPITWIEHHRSQ